MTATEAGPPAQPIVVAGRRLTPSPVFDTYWHFAAKRQALYLARLRGDHPPWSRDEILREYRFTNVFRAADRVSQYLIRRVIYGAGAPEDPEDVVFRVLLFKFFNKIDTWRHLERAVGEISWRTYDFERYSRVLDDLGERLPVYSAAYVIPPPRLGEARKSRNHLRLLEHMMRSGLAPNLGSARSLEDVYDELKRYPSVGGFLAFQFAIDLNYSPVVNHGENDFVVAGPGARDGIRKCFGPESQGIESEIIRYVAEHQEEHFRERTLTFAGLFGRPLHLIDCQNLFCEVDKYARVAHPGVAGLSGRSRIKQRFRPGAPTEAPSFPPKWGLAVPQLPVVEPVQRSLWELGD